MFFAFSFYRHVISDTFYSSSRVPSLLHTSLVSPDSPTRWVNSMASSSRARSSSPFSHRKPSTPLSSASSSTSSFTNGRVMPRSCSSSTSSFYNSGGGGRSMTPSRGHSESVYYGYGNPSPVEFGMDEEVITEPVDSSRARDSISVTIQFRPLR